MRLQETRTTWYIMLKIRTYDHADHTAPARQHDLNLSALKDARSGNDGALIRSEV